MHIPIDAGISTPLSILVWYSGTGGLTERSRNFYTEQLLSPLIASGDPYILYLYDLSAWKGLAQESASIRQQASFVDAGPLLSMTGEISPIASADFFKALELWRSRYLEEVVVTRSFPIFTSLSARRSSGVGFTTIGFEPPVIRALLEQRPILADTGYAYSMLQYLEGLWLVRELAAKALARGNSNPTLIFLLPQGELPYFYDPTIGVLEDTAFQDDVSMLLAEDPVTSGLESLRVIFADFTYCYKAPKGGICDRPYLSLPWDKPWRGGAL